MTSGSFLKVSSELIFSAKNNDGVEIAHCVTERHAELAKPLHITEFIL